MRILMVDEDLDPSGRLARQLRRQGHALYAVRAPAILLEAAAGNNAHLVILEPNLLPFNLALDLIGELRQQSQTLILALSQTGRIDERVQVLDAGADDVLTKPCDFSELMARIRALLRRHPASLSQGQATAVQVTARLWLEPSAQALVGEGKNITLSQQEFKLLSYMVQREGIVLSRETILAAVWGKDYDGSTRQVDVYIAYLRRKIEPEAAEPHHLLSVWGRGYQYRGRVPLPRLKANAVDF